MNTEMRYIYEIYRQGSFSKAAEKLFLSQPALSIAVRKVEAELKMPVFNRRQNPMTLTAAGEIYIEKVERIRQIEEDLHSEINDIAGLRVGNLNVGGTNYLNSYVLPLVISAFMKKFPNITISLSEANSGSLLGLLENGAIDVTFSCAAINTDKFIKTYAFYDTVLLAVPIVFIDRDLLPLALRKEDILAKKHLSPSAVPIDLSRFSDTPFILLNPQNNLYQRSMEFFENVHMTPRVIQKLDQLTTSYHLCCQGVGAAFIGSLIVSADSSPNVLYFCIDSPRVHRPFSAITRSNRYLSLAAREFIRMTSDIYAIHQ